MLPLLETAMALYAAHLLQTDTAASAAAEPPASPQRDDASLPALVNDAENGQPLQLALRCVDGDAWRAAPLAGHVHANGSDRCVLATVVDSQPALRFVLPPRCRFALSSAARLRACAPQLRGGGGGFRLLVADPPWECVSVARSKAYATLTCGQARAWHMRAVRLRRQRRLSWSPAAQIRALPLRQLCHPAGALVALWVTNRERIRRYVEQELLPAWGCVSLTSPRLYRYFVATWPTDLPCSFSQAGAGCGMALAESGCRWLPGAAAAR